MSETIAQKQDALTAEFAELSDWRQRYREIIAIGKALPELDEEKRADQFKVRGCQSQVWLHAELDGGVIRFEGDSDAAIVRGLVALVLRVFSGHSPAEILASDVTFVDAIGLSEHLSQTRSNGLSAMLKQIKMYAAAFAAVLARSGADEGA